MNETDIEKIVLHYENGETEEVEKGAVHVLTDDGKGILFQIKMCGMTGMDLAGLVLAMEDMVKKYKKLCSMGED